MKKIIFTLLISFCVPPSFTFAASAKGGWYLLIPPISDYNEKAQFLSGYKIFDKAPLSEWIQDSAYDTADDCEQARTTMYELAAREFSLDDDQYLKMLNDKNVSKFSLKLKRELVEGHRVGKSRWDIARCIASNDPRLIQK